MSPAAILGAIGINSVQTLTFEALNFACEGANNHVLQARAEAHKKLDNPPESSAYTPVNLEKENRSC